MVTLVDQLIISNLPAIVHAWMYHSQIKFAFIVPICKASSNDLELPQHPATTSFPCDDDNKEDVLISTSKINDFTHNDQN